MIISACVIALLMCIAAARGADDSARRVWLDVDPANAIGEIDDGLAMIQAFHSPELDVAGVSAVYGNADLEQTYPIALNATRVFGPKSVQVHRGAGAAEQRGEPTAASRAMAKALEQAPMTILALGPVTNVATLIERHPDLTDRIERIVVVAGRRSVDQQFISTPKQPDPFSDFNFEHDPRAMQTLLDSDVPLVMAPWEVSSHIWLTREDLARLRESGGSGLWIAATSQQWIDGWERRIHARGGNPFDTLAVGYLTHPQLIEGMAVTATIKRAPAQASDAASKGDQTANIDRKMKPYLVVERGNNPSRKMIYLHTPRPRFKQLLMQRLAGPKGLD